METQILHADDKLAVETAAAYLAGGELVALPTETVYGLGANAYDAEALATLQGK